MTDVYFHAAPGARAGKAGRLLLSLLILCAGLGADEVDLSPERWGEAELKKYVRTQRIAEPVFSSDKAMVTGTSSSIAIRAAVEALRQGGSAADAALTAALTHTTLAGGCTVSFAGVLTLVYFDAKSGKVFALDASYNTVLGETDPHTIPRSSRSDPSQGSGALPKGRTVLVPGFMAGVEEAHRRFGRLPFAEIFKPAIYFAEKGFPISDALARLEERSREVLNRLPATRAVFAKPDGSFCKGGEIWRQPALARTLRRVAAEGADYIYRGPWAEELVAAVRRDGGKMTLEDMQRYEARWDEPIRAGLDGNVIWLPRGGRTMAGMAHLLDMADLTATGHYAGSGESFSRFSRIISAVRFGHGLDGLSYRLNDWTDRAFAEKAWKKLQGESIPTTLRKGPSDREESSADPDGTDRSSRRVEGSFHSDAVVVVDGKGNVAALLHSSNTRGFGESGLYIGGISIPDSATFQQALLAVTEPGERLGNPTVPLVVTRDGLPVLALSAIGSGIYEESIKCLVNVLLFGKSPQEAIDAPGFSPIFRGAVDTPSTAIAVAAGAFPARVLACARKAGLTVEELPPAEARSTKGAAACIALEGDKRTRRAGSVRGFALGF